MRWRKTSVRIGTIAIALTVVLLASVGAQPARIVAVGDIHGAGGVFRALLEAAELTDAGGSWIGGNTTFVQTGDFTDRGSEVRAVMDLLMRLQQEADAAGGEARVLLGNHEALNLIASFRDVTPSIFATFATVDSETRRRDAYRDYVDWTIRRAEALGHPWPNLQTESQWLAAHPPGFFEYLDALAPDGHYGRWLRGLPVATRIDDTIFLHGGLHPDSMGRSVDDINRDTREELKRFDDYRALLVEHDIIRPYLTLEEMLDANDLELRAWVTRIAPGPPEPGARELEISRDDQEVIDALVALQGIGSWSVLNPDSPLWFRGFARWAPNEGAAFMPRVVDMYDATRLVVGHSVTSDRLIQRRFDGQVFLIDTGMLVGAYRGRASALELVGPRATAIYLDRRTALESITP